MRPSGVQLSWAQPGCWEREGVRDPSGLGGLLQCCGVGRGGGQGREGLAQRPGASPLLRSPAQRGPRFCVVPGWGSGHCLLLSRHSFPIAPPSLLRERVSAASPPSAAPARGPGFRPSTARARAVNARRLPSEPALRPAAAARSSWKKS
jgi:hypothetical protein